MTDPSDIPDGFWNDLTPQDFERPTSARHAVDVKEHQPFNKFVEASLDALRLAFHAADGQPNPVAILISDHGRLIFAPDDDETLGQYIDRLTREAKGFYAHTLFTAWLTEGGTYEGDTQHDLGSSEGLEEVSEMREVIYWYAQRKRKIRHGIMMIEAGDTGDIVEAPAEHAAHVYRQILGD